MVALLQGATAKTGMTPEQVSAGASMMAERVRHILESLAAQGVAKPDRTSRRYAAAGQRQLFI